MARCSVRRRSLEPIRSAELALASGLAIAQMMAGQYEEAMHWADHPLQEMPRYTAGIRVKVVLCAYLGHIDEARHWVGRLLDLQPGLTVAEMNAYAVRRIGAFGNVHRRAAQSRIAGTVSARCCDSIIVRLNREFRNVLRLDAA